MMLADVACFVLPDAVVHVFLGYMLNAVIDNDGPRWPVVLLYIYLRLPVYDAFSYS